MHTHTIRTRFTFNDRVRFDSSIQQCSGVGKIYAITFDGDGQFDYMIDTGRDGFREIQPGILENEITLLGAGDK
jgi:hypothetical protein